VYHKVSINRSNKTRSSTTQSTTYHINLDKKHSQYVAVCKLAKSLVNVIRLQIVIA